VPVDILGLSVAPTDLLYVDFHGALSIPDVLVPDILRVAAEQRARERHIIDLCRGTNFNFGDLVAAVKGL
jgi:regulator of RNase E activity RraA